ncbi:MAG: cupredoxin domain-containing protein [Actinomycetota bacterium]|nr:cupredoxin domain-containing protein [Actinomycetota bacterium]
MRAKHAMGLVAVLLLVTGVGCRGQRGTGETAGTPPATAAPTQSPQGGELTLGGENPNDHGTRRVVGQDEEDVELDDNYFAPTVLEGSPGQRFTVRLKNEGGITHTFTIDEQKIDEELEPNEESTPTVTFPESGTVIFYCRFHRGLGMFGGLSVQ